MTTTINMEIDETTANIYTAAPSALGKLMDEIGNKAEERGLTAEELESILHAG